MTVTSNCVTHWFVTLNHLALLGLTHFICKMEIKAIMHLTIVSKTLEITKRSITMSYSVPSVYCRAWHNLINTCLLHQGNLTQRTASYFRSYIVPSKYPLHKHMHSVHSLRCFCLCLSKNVFSIKSLFLLPLVYPLESKSWWWDQKWLLQERQGCYHWKIRSLHVVLYKL